MRYTLSEYEDTYEVRREGETSVIGFLQLNGGQWGLNVSSSCGWLSEGEVKRLASRLFLLNMLESVATKGEKWYSDSRDEEDLDKQWDKCLQEPNPLKE